MAVSQARVIVGRSDLCCCWVRVAVSQARVIVDGSGLCFCVRDWGRFSSKSYSRPFGCLLLCACGHFSSKSYCRPFGSLLLMSSWGHFSSMSYRRTLRSLLLCSWLRPFLKQKLLQAIPIFVVCVWPFLKRYWINSFRLLICWRLNHAMRWGLGDAIERILHNVFITLLRLLCHHLNHFCIRTASIVFLSLCGDQSNSCWLMKAPASHRKFLPWGKRCGELIH